jgi:hypothetical protein
LTSPTKLATLGGARHGDACNPRTQEAEAERS